MNTRMLTQIPRRRVLLSLSHHQQFPAPLHQSQVHNRSFASTIPTMAGIVQVITKDHREIESYYQNILNAKDNDEATRWQNQFVWQLARHSIGEELVVYPAFEKKLGQKGKQMADKDRQEHQVVKEKLYKFQGLKAGSPDFIPTLKDLMEPLVEHIKEEENDDLPALESALSEADSESMAKSFRRTKAFVPSRSHPSAPAKPPFETVVGLMSAPIDHITDLFRKFPDETISPNPNFTK